MQPGVLTLKSTKSDSALLQLCKPDFRVINRCKFLFTDTFHPDTLYRCVQNCFDEARRCSSRCHLFLWHYSYSGFGGLEVPCWLLVPKFAGSNPAEAVFRVFIKFFWDGVDFFLCWFLRAKKILSTPSFGGKVKPSVSCRRFAACKRSLELGGSRILNEICLNISLPRRVPPSAARGLSRRWTWRHLEEGGKV